MEVKVLSAICSLPPSTDCCDLQIALQAHALTPWSGINIFRRSFITTQVLFSSLWLKLPM